MNEHVKACILWVECHHNEGDRTSPTWIHSFMLSEWAMVITSTPQKDDRKRRRIALTRVPWNECIFLCCWMKQQRPAFACFSFSQYSSYSCRSKMWHTNWCAFMAFILRLCPCRPCCWSPCGKREATSGAKVGAILTTYSAPWNKRHQDGLADCWTRGH